jgi:hypothetical protein
LLSIILISNFPSHERAWLKNDIFSVQVQAVLEVENQESAKEIENIIRQKYEKVTVGPYGNFT